MTKSFYRHCFLILVVIFVTVDVSDAQESAESSVDNLKVIELRCEYLVNPLGIDVESPCLGWKLIASAPAARNKSQTAFHIIASTTQERLMTNIGDLWDSGKVASRESIRVTYGGKPLSSRQRIYWKVRVWDENDSPSDWSTPAWWEMALLNKSDWQAQWIQRDEILPSDEDKFDPNPNPIMRKEVSIEKPFTRARAYVSGLGYYELRLNGEKVGKNVLDPAWTDYSKRVLYSTFDVTQQITHGENVIGIMLGNGWRNPLPLKMWDRVDISKVLPVGLPCVILQLEVTHKDGSRTTIVTDNSWKTGDGPIVKNSVYLGETYDARLEQEGWDSPGFDDTDWANAVPISNDLGPLRAQMIEPIRIGRIIKPIEVTESENGVYIVDMGENFAGVVRLEASGPGGTRIDLRYGELLYEDGTLNGMTAVCGQVKNIERPTASKRPVTAWQQDTYILKGDDEETFEPRFTFHGFRYVEIKGYPGKLTLDDIEGLAMYSSVEESGTFECSNELFNQIHDITRRTILSNILGVQSDCPHREKFGYGGDIVACSEAALLNFNMARFYAKAVEDLADGVRENGGFTETAPFVGIADSGLGDSSGPIGWGTAHPLLLRQLHQYYGETRLIAQEYERVANWIELLSAVATDSIVNNGISDHESLVDKPGLSGTAFYAMNVALARDLADILGREEDVRRFQTLLTDIFTAFNEKYSNNDGVYGSGTQASQAFALYAGLVPEGMRQKTLDVLVKNVMEKHSGHLTTGIFGTKYMLDILSTTGHHNVAYTMVDQRSFPGWGHMIENGATTLWEHWQFSDNTFSHNPPMFGSVDEWLMKHVAGIKPTQGAVGFDHVIIAPKPKLPELSWTTASYESMRGTVYIHWEIQEDTMELQVEIPVGVTAQIIMPGSREKSGTEVGSGHHRFTHSLGNSH